MFRFESPTYFFLVGLIIFFLLSAILIQRRSGARLKNQLGGNTHSFLVASVSLKKRRFKWLLVSLCLFFMIYSLARPQLGQGREQIKSEGFELIFAVDVSESMLAEDVRPNRLDQAKKELERLLELMPGNRVGLIAFSGNAALVSPITTDSSAIRMFLDSLSPSTVGEAGTCFECALKLAEEALDRGGVGGENQIPVTRVILVASDGEDHEAGALGAAQSLVKKGVRIFSLAYGTEKGGPIPLRDSMGFQQGYKKDSQGQTVISQVRGDALRVLAQEGKGSFYFASFGGDHLASLVEDFQKLEKTLFDTELAAQYEEMFQAFLWIVLLLGLLELWVSDRDLQSKKRPWRGRYV